MLFVCKKLNFSANGGCCLRHVTEEFSFSNVFNACILHFWCKTLISVMISMYGSSGRLAVSLIFTFVSVFVLCEYVIYYPVILRCSWPHIETVNSHLPLRALFLSDTHLLGAIKGHWLDKLRRYGSGASKSYNMCI